MGAGAGRTVLIAPGGGTAWIRPGHTACPPETPPSITLQHVNIDDWLFGVSSVSAEGYESPVSFPFSERQ